MNEEENEMWNDPDNWKWGFVYFNPKDKRVFVLKRVPWMGITLNFANPLSGLVIFALILSIWIASHS